MRCTNLIQSSKHHPQDFRLPGYQHRARALRHQQKLASRLSIGVSERSQSPKDADNDLQVEPIELDDEVEAEQQRNPPRKKLRTLDDKRLHPETQSSKRQRKPATKGKKRASITKAMSSDADAYATWAVESTQIPKEQPKLSVASPLPPTRPPTQDQSTAEMSQGCRTTLNDRDLVQAETRTTSLTVASAADGQSAQNTSDGSPPSCQLITDLALHRPTSGSRRLGSRTASHTYDNPPFKRPWRRTEEERPAEDLVHEYPKEVPSEFEEQFAITQRPESRSNDNYEQPGDIRSDYIDDLLGSQEERTRAPSTPTHTSMGAVAQDNEQAKSAHSAERLRLYEQERQRYFVAPGQDAPTGRAQLDDSGDTTSGFVALNHLSATKPVYLSRGSSAEVGNLLSRCV